MEQETKSLLFSIVGVILIATISLGYLFYRQYQLTNPTSNLPGLAEAKPRAGQPPTSNFKVAVTIFPLYDILRNLAGDKLEVKLILPPGASPHTFELTPAQIKDLQDTKFIFAIGHGLDDWASQVAQNISSAQVFFVDQNINFIQEGERLNPHYFLSVKNAKIIAQTIAQKLTELDSPNRNFYQESLQDYLQALETLDNTLISNFHPQPPTSNLQPPTSNSIATFHAAWSYFARDYNLEVVASFEPSPGKEPSPQDLKDFEDKIRENHLSVIFSEPQLASDILGPIAKDLGVEIKILDPIGGIEARDSFINLMEYNARTILQSLQ